MARRLVTNRLVRLACDRHLRDLELGPKRGLLWDVEAVTRVARFFSQVLRLNGGVHEGQPFTLERWQLFIEGSLFGWKRADTGARRYRTAYLEIAKGNGKSPLAAGTGIYMLMADGEARAEVYAAAAKKDQAMILFRDAVAMVAQSPALAKRVVKSGGNPVWNLAVPATGSFFRPIASDDAQSGPRPHCALLDEIHEHQDATVIDLMRAGSKGRRQALFFEITNSGWDQTSVCWRHHDYSAQILEGHKDDDEWFAFICGLDPGEDYRDAKVWKKANPNLGVSITKEYLRRQVREAEGMPAQQGVVRRLNFCEWTNVAAQWITREVWDARRNPDHAVPDGASIVLGFDGSYNRDSTALVGCTLEATPHLFVVGVWERPDDADKDWAVPRGEVLDAILAAHARWRVARFAFDDTFGGMWAMDFEGLGEKGVELVSWPTRSQARIGPAATAFLGALQDGRLTHDGDPRLAQHVTNAVAKGSRWGLLPTKGSPDSRHHIDLLIGAIIALDMANRQPPESGWHIATIPRGG